MRDAQMPVRGTVLVLTVSRSAFMAETARLAREARAARNGGDRSAKWPAR
jgi:hypothetical protein